MASYAEGLNILAHANIGAAVHAKDAETAPLANPEYYRYDLDLAAITEVWRRGSVVASWLLDLTAAAMHPTAPRRFEVRSATAARAAGRSTPRSTKAVPARFCLLRCTNASARVVTPASPTRCCPAMRSQFGGHAEKAPGELVDGRIKTVEAMPTEVRVSEIAQITQDGGR